MFTSGNSVPALFALAGLVFALGHNASNINVRVDPKDLSSDQRLAVDKLRTLVKNDATMDFMTGDFFLATLLSEQHFNVDVAQNVFREYLEWRKELKMDTIFDENWSDMRAKFPYSYNTTDKAGKPLVFMDMAEWDVCGYLGEGESSTQRMTRYMLMFLEELEHHIRSLRDQGHNVRNARVIINGAGLSREKHLCTSFGYFIRDLMNRRAKIGHPKEDKVILLNMANSYRTIFSLFGQLATSRIEVYGQDRAKWEPVLLETIQKDQFPAGLSRDPTEKENMEGLLPWHHEL